MMADARARADREAPGAVTGDGSAELPSPARRALSRLHKGAFGTAVGAVAALAVAGVTGVHLLLGPDVGVPLSLLGQFFYGYTVSTTGLVVGGLWGFGTGFVAGWFTAFVRNFVVGCYLHYGRAKAELEAGRDFLDHI